MGDYGSPFTRPRSDSPAATRARDLRERQADRVLDALEVLGWTRSVDLAILPGASVYVSPSRRTASVYLRSRDLIIRVRVRPGRGWPEALAACVDQDVRPMLGCHVADRDPRIEPRPGDCLRGPRGGRRWVEATITPWLDVVWHDDTGRRHTATRPRWWAWAASATVVRRAEEVVR